MYRNAKIMKRGKPTPEEVAAAKKHFLQVLERRDVLGLIYRAHKITGVTITTHYHWYENDPQYKASVDRIRKARKEFAEHRLYDLVKNGDPSSTQFVVRCLRREEYTPDLKLSGDPENPAVQIKLDPSLIEKAIQDVYSKKRALDVKRSSNPS